MMLTSRLPGDSHIGLPGEVYEVRSLGSEVENEDGSSRAGTYRVVTLRVGFDHLQTVIVIQWMERGSGQEVPSVVAARRVELLDDLGPITVSPVRVTKAPNELNLSIRVENIVSGEVGEVQAVAGPPDRLTAKYTRKSRR